MIQVKCGIGVIEYTQEELQKEIEDLNFLRDAFLVLLNSDVTKKSDIPFSKEEVLKYAKEMYSKTNYSKEFIDKCFST
jgi:hypothetical protein